MGQGDAPCSDAKGFDVKGSLATLCRDWLCRYGIGDDGAGCDRLGCDRLYRIPLCRKGPVREARQRGLCRHVIGGDWLSSVGAGGD